MDTIFFDSKVWSKPKEKYLKNREIEEFVPPQYIKKFPKIPGKSKNFPGMNGKWIFGNFPEIPGREFPGDSPRLDHDQQQNVRRTLHHSRKRVNLT